MFETKSDIVRRLVSSRDYKKALSIAKGFRLGISHEDSDKMARAYECMIYPKFYDSLGVDLEFAIAEGIQTLQTLYG